MLQIKVNNENLDIILEDNSSTKALKNYLKEKKSLSLYMKDYAHMEKFGDLNTTLPTNDKRITTKPGDLILYLGKYLVIYYDTNNWDLTRLGRVSNLDSNQLKKVLGKGDIDVTLTLIDE